MVLGYRNTLPYAGFGQRIMFDIFNTNKIIYATKIGFIGLGKLGMPSQDQQQDNNKRQYYGNYQ